MNCTSSMSAEKVLGLQLVCNSTVPTFRDDWGRLFWRILEHGGVRNIGWGYQGCQQKINFSLSPDALQAMSRNGWRAQVWEMSCSRQAARSLTGVLGLPMTRLASNLNTTSHKSHNHLVPGWLLLEGVGPRRVHHAGGWHAQRFWLVRGQGVDSGASGRCKSEQIQLFSLDLYSRLYYIVYRSPKYFPFDRSIDDYRCLQMSTVYTQSGWLCHSPLAFCRSVPDVLVPYVCYFVIQKCIHNMT